MGLFSKITQSICRLFGRDPLPIVRPVDYGRADQRRIDPYSRAVGIEATYQLTSIHGIPPLQIGPTDRVLESETDGLTRIQQQNGIQPGCGDIVLQASPNGTIPGLGGQCIDCLEEAVLKNQQGLISVEQVYIMSLYCSNCASRCDACGKNMCRRHTIQSADPDGRTIRLCSNCHKTIQQNRILQSALSVVFGPFMCQPDSNIEPTKRAPDVR
jgi:hypothetical protein